MHLRVFPSCHFTPPESHARALDPNPQFEEKRTYQMRILHLLQHLDIIQLNIEELVDGFKGAFDGDVVFELDGDFVVDEGFEEAG